jgi:hypothetical protein
MTERTCIMLSKQLHADEHRRSSMADCWRTAGHVFAPRSRKARRELRLKRSSVM